MVAKGLARKKIASGGARQPWWREVGSPFVEIGSGKILACTLTPVFKKPAWYCQRPVSDPRFFPDRIEAGGGGAGRPGADFQNTIKYIIKYINWGGPAWRIHSLSSPERKNLVHGGLGLQDRSGRPSCPFPIPGRVPTVAAASEVPGSRRRVLHCVVLPSDQEPTLRRPHDRCRCGPRTSRPGLQVL